MPNKRRQYEVLATVALHKEGAQDEPLGIDVDVTVTCHCGMASMSRREIYKEQDWVPMMCNACGATYRVDVSTVLVFIATPVKEAASVLEVTRAK